jgi:hypothetical protein
VEDEPVQQGRGERQPVGGGDEVVQAADVGHHEDHPGNEGELTEPLGQGPPAHHEPADHEQGDARGRVAEDPARVGARLLSD